MAEAADAAMAVAPDFDLAVCLSVLIEAGIVTGFVGDDAISKSRRAD